MYRQMHWKTIFLKFKSYRLMIFASEIEKSANKNQISEKPNPMIYKKSSQLQIEEEILKQLTLMFELNC